MGCALALASLPEAQPKDASADARWHLAAAKPLLEPMVQYGPFVMNARQEICQAVSDLSARAMAARHWEAGLSESFPVAYCGSPRRPGWIAAGPV